MSEFTVLAGGPFSDPEVLALYESVGWGAYTREPKVLAAAVRGSSFVVTARNSGGGFLITDNEPGQRAFYESLGFTEGSDFRPEPVRVFAQFR